MKVKYKTEFSAFIVSTIQYTFIQHISSIYTSITKIFDKIYIIYDIGNEQYLKIWAYILIII